MSFAARIALAIAKTPRRIEMMPVMMVSALMPPVRPWPKPLTTSKTPETISQIASRMATATTVATGHTSATTPTMMLMMPPTNSSHQ